MPASYTYHSDDATPYGKAWVQYALIVAGLALLGIAAYEFYLYTTAWESDDGGSWWPVLLGVLYSLIGLLLVYAGFRRARMAKAHHADHVRFVHLRDGALEWKLEQKVSKESIAVTDISDVERRNVRDLVLRLKNGTERILPIYLITEDKKQGELVAALKSVAKSE